MDNIRKEIYDGGLMRLRLDEGYLHHEVDISLESSYELKEVASTTGNAEYVSGKGTWRISGTAYVSVDDAEVYFEKMWKKHILKELVDIELLDGVTWHLAFSGKVYVNSISFVAKVDEFMQYQFEMTGNGILNSKTIL